VVDAVNFTFISDFSHSLVETAVIRS